MENSKELFGEVFIDGRIVNLDEGSIDDLKRYMSDLDRIKVNADAKFDKIVNEIRNM
jgi:hypothetical protein